MRDALTPDAIVYLNGCATAWGSDNIAREMSLALPGRTVVGDIIYGLYVGYNTVLAPRRSYVNGVEQ